MRTSIEGEAGLRGERDLIGRGSASVSVHPVALRLALNEALSVNLNSIIVLFFYSSVSWISTLTMILGMKIAF